MVVEHPRRRPRRVHSRGRGVGAAHGSTRRHRREVPIGLAALRRGHKKPSRSLEGISHSSINDVLRRRILTAVPLRGDVGRQLGGHLTVQRRLLTFEQFLDRVRRGRMAQIGSLANATGTLTFLIDSFRPSSPRVRRRTQAPQKRPTKAGKTRALDTVFASLVFASGTC